MKKYKVGDAVEALITRSGGKTVKIVGKIAGFENAFGREDLIIEEGTSEKFVVNKKNVKAVKEPVE